MPPRTRRQRPAEEPTEGAPTEARHAKTDGPICTKCWPKGWPTETAYNAACRHGAWKR